MRGTRPVAGACMSRNGSIGFAMGVFGGIILGALIDNMAIGLLIGFALGFGILKFPVKRGDA